METEGATVFNWQHSQSEYGYGPEYVDEEVLMVLVARLLSVNTEVLFSNHHPHPSPSVLACSED